MEPSTIFARMWVGNAVLMAVRSGLEVEFNIELNGQRERVSPEFASVLLQMAAQGAVGDGS